MSRIYWGSNLKNPRFSNMWEPAICAVSRANGNFLSRWSIFTLNKNFNPDQIKYAVGVSEVTLKQQAAVALDPDIFVVGEADIQKQVSALPVDTTAKIADFVQQKVKISPTGSKETTHTVFNRMSVATDNTTLTGLEAQLDSDMKLSKADMLGLLIVPTMLAAENHLKLYRRQLLKLGLISAAYLLWPKKAHSSTVFNDIFSVDVDTDIVNPAVDYPNWTDTGEGFNLYVNAVNDRAQYISNGPGTAYISAGGIITGDQKITADCFSTTGAYAGLLTRVDTGTLNFYLAFFDVDLNLVEIYRYDGGGFASLESLSRAVSYPASCSFTASGTGATVTLTAIGGGTAAVIKDDASGSRLTSGPPGIRIYQNNDFENLAWIDNVVVDDLAAPPASSIRRKPILQ